MKKYLLIVSSLILFISCTPFDIVDDKRILIKGNVSTEEEGPLNEIPIKLLTSYSNGFSPYYYENYDKFHEGYSDLEGNFSFTTFDIKNGELMVAFNKGPDYESTLNEYQSLTFLDEDRNRSEFLIDFGTLILKKRAEINLSFINQSGTENNLHFNVEVMHPDPIISIYNWTDFSEIEDPYHDPRVQVFSSTITASETVSNHDFFTLENSEAILNYSVGTDSEQITIPVSSSNTTYEIVY